MFDNTSFKTLAEHEAIAYMLKRLSILLQEEIHGAMSHAYFFIVEVYAWYVSLVNLWVAKVDAVTNTSDRWSDRAT